MKNFFYIFFVLTMLIFCGNCQKKLSTEKPIIAEVNVNQNKLTIGDKFTFSLAIENLPYIEYQEPQITDAFKNFTIRNYGVEKTQSRIFKKKKYYAWYLLDTFIIGEYEIPRITINYKNKKTGKEEKIKTKKIKISVKSTLKGDVQNIKDIKPPVEIKVSYKKLWLTLSVLLIIIAGGIILYYFYKNKPKIFRVKPIPAHVRILDELKELENSNLINENLKEYYIKLSDIVRYYIETRFKLMAPERTTEEFLVEIKDAVILTPAQKTLLEKFLEQCDLVKFAKYGSSVDEAKEALKAAKGFVEETAEKNTEDR
jgi:hypothetical protein